MLEARRPRPVRAMLGAHYTANLAANLRRSSRLGFWTKLVLGGALLLSYVAMIVGGMGITGWHVGAFLRQRLATAEGAVAGLLTFYVAVFSCTAAIEGGTRRLPWERLRVFPVTTRSLFIAELCTSLLDANCLVPVLGLLAFCTTASLRTPHAAPLYALLFVTQATLLLTLPQVLGGLFQRASRKLKLTLFLVSLFGLLLCSVSMVQVLSVLPPDLATRLREGGGVVAALQPSHALVVAANDLARGELSRQRALVAPLFPLALALASLRAAFWLISREAPLARPNDGTSTRLWSFRHPVWGVARLQWAMLMGCMQGRFALAFPLLGLLVSFGVTRTMSPVGGVLFAFMYSGFGLVGLMSSLFGLDRHGIKALLLLPLDERQLLRGKVLGHALLAGAQTLILVALFAGLRLAPASAIAVGVVAYACVFLLLGMMGMPFSVWVPRPVRTSGARVSAPLLLLLVVLGAVPALGLIVGGLLVATTIWLPGWELAVGVALFCVLLGLFELLLRVSARYLARHRERLVELLGGAA